MDDGGYVTLIRENYSCISEKYSRHENKRLKWELVKMELRGLKIPYAKNKAKIFVEKREISKRD